MTPRRRSWAPRLALAAAACAAASGVAALAQGLVRDERTESRQLRFAGAGPHTLDARTFSGSIRVTGDGGGDVRVQAVTAVEAETAEALQAAKRNVVFESLEQGATVALTVRDGGRTPCGESGSWRDPAWWDRRRYSAAVTLTVQVPRDVRVRLCAVNGEELVVNGIDGDFDVSNVNGRVRLDGMRGSGRATTVNGSVEVAFAAAPRDESLFKTVNGAIAVTFPRDLAADLRLKAFNGEVYTDFDTTALPVAPEPARHQGAPKFVYKKQGFTNVRVGAGGPALTFDTLNGDVRILRAAR